MIAENNGKKTQTSRNKNPAKKTIIAVWEAYKKRPTLKLRTILEETYIPFVNREAKSIYESNPYDYDLEELKQQGYLGLRDAVDDYDLSRGVEFEVYSSKRIRGAMLDHIRDKDWLPRLVKSRTVKVDKIRNRLKERTGYNPTNDEIRKEMGIGNSEFERIVKDSHPVDVVSLNRVWSTRDSDKETREIQMFADKKQKMPIEDVQRADLKEMILKGLSRTERLIVVLYYYEGMTMNEIGKVIGSSGSRVSQISGPILERLKDRLSNKELEFIF